MTERGLIQESTFCCNTTETTTFHVNVSNWRNDIKERIITMAKDTDPATAECSRPHQSSRRKNS
jgi:hypothetical protein